MRTLNLSLLKNKRNYVEQNHIHFRKLLVQQHHLSLKDFKIMFVPIYWYNQGVRVSGFWPQFPGPSRTVSSFFMPIRNLIYHNVPKNQSDLAYQIFTWQDTVIFLKWHLRKSASNDWESQNCYWVLLLGIFCYPIFNLADTLGMIDFENRPMEIRQLY